MKVKAGFYPILAALLALWPRPSDAVDDSAANLVAEGGINLTQMTDALNRKYPKEKEAFWNVSGIAYHDFSGAPQSDVIVGLSGYRDKGMVYNNEKQLVEDAGAGFAYFHLEKDEWKLRQVELVEGKRYEGFEGANLMGSGGDQLVIYTSDGKKQIAAVYGIGKNRNFAKIAVITGYGLGPRVASESGKPLMVDFQPALINNQDDWAIYFGRAYPWDGKKFVKQNDDFLDHVQAFDPFHSTPDETTQELAFFEGYLSTHPDDFCTLANCYELSSRMGLKEKADGYRKKLAHGDSSIDCKYCDEWLMDKNKAGQEVYLDEILGKKKLPKNQE